MSSLKHFFLICILSVSSLSAQDFSEAYQYAVDLNDINEDAVKVTLDVPEGIRGDKLVFHFPKIIPGTYEIANFGRFVSSLKAFDRKGKELQVKRIDENTWNILKAKRIDKLSYIIEDTWDAEVRSLVFEASGSNFESRKNFLLNHNACFGFFDNEEKRPYVLTFKRPATFYGSTSLKRIGGDFDTDIYKARNYRDLVDAPILYCKPDTVNFKVGFGKIQIAVYSPNNIVTAKDIAKELRPMLEAQNKYLGNILPVDRYSFLIYLSPNGYPSGAIGALEHSRSSVFCMAEEAPKKISKMMRDFASHEFFHIVTPLYIHSEQIHNFDFMEPKLSKHLWLYEGVIEYMSQHMQAKYNIIEKEDFVKSIEERAKNATRYKQGISLVELSKRCIEPKYEKQYNNIYNKGSLVAMFLDLKLLELSKGKYDLQSMLRDLSGRYGQDTPFNDEELFDEIIALSGYEELREFFKDYVEGTKTLPYNEFLEKFGVKYFEEADIMDISPLGGLENRALKTDSLDRFYVGFEDRLDKFGREYIQFKKGDVLLEWNGKVFNKSTAGVVLFSYMDSAKEGDKLEVLVERKDKKGNASKILLKTALKSIPMKAKNVFRLVEDKDITPTQKVMQARWLEIKK